MALKGKRYEMYTLGRIYAFENRSLGRFMRGVKLLERAAKKLVKEASYYLAVLYFNGDGVKRDLDKAAGYASDASLSGSSRIEDAAEELHRVIDTIKYKSY
jgi:TPR repeat protein